MTYAITFFTACLLSYLITPVIRYVGLKFRIVDKKEARKVHRKVVTKLGGLAMFFAFHMAMIVGFLFEYSFLNESSYFISGMLVACVIILCLGVFDDVRSANAFVKLAVQILASIIVIRVGLSLESVSFLGERYELGQLSIPITILFILVLTNAVNFLDGLDGLAAGFVFILMIAVFVVNFLTVKDFYVGLSSLALSGASLGFLGFNFYPAKIFMGDTGSLFLGFVASVLILRIMQFSQGPGLPLLCVVFLLALPLVDVAAAIVRRLLKKRHLLRPDASHIHHYLLARGLSQRQVVISLYLFTCLGGFIAIGIILFGGIK